MWIECAENGMNLPAAGRNNVKPEQHPVVIPACLQAASVLVINYARIIALPTLILKEAFILF